MNPAFIGKTYIEIGTGASPATYERYCEVDTIGGIGTKNALVDVTTFCSDGFMEYIPGLADGAEVTFGANYTLTTDEALQEALIDHVEDKDTIPVRLAIGDGSPQKHMSFHMAMLSWELAPSVSGKNQIKFTGKITGRIVRT